MQFTGPALARGVSLPFDMWEALRIRAKAEGRNVSNLIRWTLERDFAPHAPAGGIEPPKAQAEKLVEASE